MNRKSTSVWTLSSVVTILCLMAGCLHGVGFTWTGVIVMTPESGLVACGNDLGARVVDAFDVARPLPDNEYVVDGGNPTYSWYLNDSEIPCKWGRSVVFSTGDWDECGENGGRPDIDAGDFTLSVKGSRTYVVVWKDGNDCPCGCGMDDCECGGNGFRGCGGCGGKETKRGSSRQDAPVRGRH